MAVVCDNAWHNGYTGLDGKMESTLLERKQHGLLGVTSSTLWEHVDALSLGLDLGGGALHSLTGILAVLAIDKDGAAQGHEPAEEGHLLEGSLCGYTAVLGEHCTEHENIELGLVVPNENSWSRGAKDIVRVFNDKLNASGVEHEIAKGAANGPLRDLLLADDGEKNRCENTIGGDDEKGYIRCEATGGEGGLRYDEGHGVEEDDESGVAEDEVSEDAGEGHDGRVNYLYLEGEEGCRRTRQDSWC